MYVMTVYLHNTGMTPAVYIFKAWVNPIPEQAQNITITGHCNYMAG